MFQKELFKRLFGHVSSISISLIMGITYLINGHSFLDDYLPPHSKVIASVLLISIIVVYELTVYNARKFEEKLCFVASEVKGISSQMDINRLKHSVNALYARFEDSKDKFITHEYTIKELYELSDLREKLCVNSYTQGKLIHLISKINRG